MKKILIIRLGAIGDVVETTGLIHSLGEQGYQVDYLTGKVPAQLLEHDKMINNLFILQKKSYSNIFDMAFKLRKEKYDLVLNLQPSIRFKVLCFLLGVKKVVSYKKSYEFHAVENFFDTGKRAIPELTLEKNIHLNVPETIKNKMSEQLESKTKICFNIGANSSRQGRKWCVEYWAELAKLIFNKYDVQIFLVGSTEDEAGANTLTTMVPQIKSFVSKTSLIETAALLSCADIVISGDTGPLHIASAVGTVCVGLYGCCSVSRSGPYGEKHFTITSPKECAPCDARKCKYLQSDIDNAPCMRDIKPEKVLNLVDTILK